MTKKETTKTSSFTTQNLAVTAMLSAAAFVLMYMEITVPFMPSFVKFDFSDLPALLGAFALGPLYGIVIEFMKNLLHLLVSQSMFIGELSNFILGSVFTFTAGLIYKRKKTKKRALLGGIAGSAAMGVISIFSNYFIVYPVYVAVYFNGDTSLCVDMYRAIVPAMKTLLQCLICFNLPFTLVKGLISVALSMLIYKPLSRFLKRKF
jgi:riboflavin transporter FmnP